MLIVERCFKIVALFTGQTLRDPGNIPQGVSLGRPDIWLNRDLQKGRREKTTSYKLHIKMDPGPSKTKSVWLL